MTASEARELTNKALKPAIDKYLGLIRKEAEKGNDNLTYYLTDNEIKVHDRIVKDLHELGYRCSVTLGSDPEEGAYGNLYVCW